jgi:hypothetical protein
LEQAFAAGRIISTADCDAALRATNGDLEAAAKSLGLSVVVAPPPPPAPAPTPAPAPAPAPSAPLLSKSVPRSDAPPRKPFNVELTVQRGERDVGRTVPPKQPEAPKEPGEQSFVGGSKEMFTANKLYFLLVVVPVAAVSPQLGLSDGAIFSLSCIAILPLAALLGDATEQLALHTNEVGGRGALSPHRPAPRAPAPPLTRRGAASGQTLGGLLNATFGNATELIVSFFLLLEGELDVVKVSLLGAARALRDEAPPPLAPPHLAGRGLRHALGLWRAVPAR